MMKLDGIAADFQKFSEDLGQERESLQLFGRLSMREPRFALGTKHPHNQAKLIFLDDVKHGEEPRNQPRMIEIEFFDKNGYLGRTTKSGKRITQKYQFTIPAASADDPSIKEYLRALEEWQPECGPKVMMCMYFTVLVLDISKDPSDKYYARRELFRYTPRWWEDYKTHVLMGTQDYGTLRGLQFFVRRPSEPTSPCLGKPEPQTFRNAKGEEVIKVCRHLSDAKLIQQFGHEARKTKDGTVYAEANADVMPFNYREILKPLSVDELRSALGLKSLAASMSSATAVKRAEFTADDVLEEVTGGAFKTQDDYEDLDTSSKDQAFIENLLGDSGPIED